MIIITTIVALIFFSVMIFVHELGHFACAKYFGVKVREFSLGMGPSVYKKQKGETLYSIRAIPIGGYVSMEGEDEQSDDPRAFSSLVPWKRFIIVVAGAVMNLILGLVLCIFVVASHGVVSVPIISAVSPNSPSEAAGLMVGDRIIEVNGHKTMLQSEVQFQLYRSKDSEIPIVVQRGQEEKLFYITPVLLEEEGRYIIGYSGTILNLNLLESIKYGYRNLAFYSVSVITSLGDLISGKESVRNLSGPVGIVGTIGSVVDTALSDKQIDGFLSIVNLLILLTVNLGIFNLLPFPALDGGRLVFIVIEQITRKKIPPEKEGIIHFVGFALLMMLVIFATGNDLLRIKDSFM